jgi:hypothetical protein
MTKSSPSAYTSSSRLEPKTFVATALDSKSYCIASRRGYISWPGFQRVSADAMMLTSVMVGAESDPCENSLMRIISSHKLPLCELVRGYPAVAVGSLFAL